MQLCAMHRVVASTNESMRGSPSLKEGQNNASFDIYFEITEFSNCNNKGRTSLFRTRFSRMHMPRTCSAENPRMIRHLTRISMNDKMDSYYSQSATDVNI